MMEYCRQGGRVGKSWISAAPSSQPYTKERDVKSFDDIEILARGHHPDFDDRLTELGHAKSREELIAMPDDRWLAMMTRCVFQAGFVWKVIEAKWDGFEAAFDQFDPSRVSFYSDDDIARLASDTRIVRNGQKIIATVTNAGLVAELSAEHGGFGKFMADWPAGDQTGLMALLKKRGSRLSGMTAQYFLRFSGWGGWMLSKDVIAALIREGVVEKAPTSKAALASVETAFSKWSAASGRPRADISRILALSIG
jgi:3-methyladenine DNA glycosylase Tag